ncbi:MAG: hypothetical protein ACFCUE_04535 [Candidatus Bathyarchaeia archaeon]
MSETNFEAFFEDYVKAKNGKIIFKKEIMHVTYPDKAEEEFTYHPSVAKEKKVPLIAPGSPVFQQILRECQENGVLCQIQLNPKDDIESEIKRHFKDATFACIDCDKVTIGEKEVSICVKPQSCYHQINCGKICQVKVGKQEQSRYFEFFYSVIFYNKLRAKNEEIITVLLDEKANVVEVAGFGEGHFAVDSGLAVLDVKSKVKPDLFDHLKGVADEQLEALIGEKVAFFDLPLNREKKVKLQAFEKRIKRERREQILSRKHDFDPLKWQNNYLALLKREEEAYLTNISVKLINLLVVNTCKVKFNLVLDNDAAVHSILTLGLNQTVEVTCPICKKSFTEGYATRDGQYVCGNCIRQSIDSGRVYSKKAALILDDTLNEYLEQGSGFVCSVCGKRHSRLLEFNCSHDGSSVCIAHYGFCDVCGSGKIYSKANLSYTDEFKHQLCPKHSGKCKQ